MSKDEESLKKMRRFTAWMLSIVALVVCAVATFPLTRLQKDELADDVREDLDDRFNEIKKTAMHDDASDLKRALDARGNGRIALVQPRCFQIVYLDDDISYQLRIKSSIIDVNPYTETLPIEIKPDSSGGNCAGRTRIEILNAVEARMLAIAREAAVHILDSPHPMVTIDQKYWGPANNAENADLWNNNRNIRNDLAIRRMQRSVNEHKVFTP